MVGFPLGEMRLMTKSVFLYMPGAIYDQGSSTLWIALQQKVREIWPEMFFTSASLFLSDIVSSE